MSENQRMLLYGAISTLLGVIVSLKPIKHLPLVRRALDALADAEMYLDQQLRKTPSSKKD